MFKRDKAAESSSVSFMLEETTLYVLVKAIFYLSAIPSLPE
jgi:hypothetical protein